MNNTKIILLIILLCIILVVSIYKKRTNPKRIEKIIPSNIALDENNLPYVISRKYGYGKRFNAFVAINSECYHKSNCPTISGCKKTVLHVYNAMNKYRPCPVCNPKSKVDEWYITYMNKKKDEI